MSNKLLNSLQLKGFLSFGPGSGPVELTELNVLIGPNGVGKSNFIEAIELLHASPTDLPGAIRIGGTPADWLWKAQRPVGTGEIEAHLAATGGFPELALAISGNRANWEATCGREHRHLHGRWWTDGCHANAVPKGDVVVPGTRLAADAQTWNSLPARRVWGPTGGV